MQEPRDQAFLPLDVSQTLSRVAHIFIHSSHVRTFIQLALFFIIPATAIMLSVVYGIMQGTIHGGTSGHPIKFFFRNLQSFLVLLGSQSFVRASLGAVADGAISIAVADLYLSRRPMWFMCLKAAAARLVTLLIAGILSGLAIFTGYLFLFVPGLILYLSLFVVTPVVVLEPEISALGSLGRSWDLVRGHRWYVLACVVALGIMQIIATWILQWLFLSGLGTILTLSYHLVNMIPAMIFLPAFSILKTVVYINLRVIKEGLCYEQFEREVREPSMEGLRMGADYRRIPLMLDQEDEVVVSKPLEEQQPEWTRV